MEVTDLKAAISESKKKAGFYAFTLTTGCSDAEITQANQDPEIEVTSLSIAEPVTSISVLYGPLN